MTAYESKYRTLVPHPALTPSFISIAGALAWSAIPVGALDGGWAGAHRSVALVHAVIGAADTP